MHNLAVNKMSPLFKKLISVPSQNLPRVSVLEPSIPGCKLPSVFSERKLFLISGTAWRTALLTTWRANFQLSDVQVLWSWHHRLRIWALLVIKGSAIAALRWMLDLWSSSERVSVETVLKMNAQFCCHLCCSSSDFSKQSSSMYDDLFLSMLFLAHCSSSLMLSSHDSCMPI
jgi:hypothetical protein